MLEQYGDTQSHSHTVTTITHLLVSLQLPGVNEAPLVSSMRDPMVDEMEFVV